MTGVCKVFAKATKSWFEVYTPPAELEASGRKKGFWETLRAHRPGERAEPGSTSNKGVADAGIQEDSGIN